MNEVFALAGKDLRLLLRDKAGFFFTFFFPMIIAVFFGSIFGSPDRGNTAMTLLFFDEDQSQASAEFRSFLDKAEEIKLISSSRQEATEKVRKGQAIAYIALKKGFGEAWERLFWGDPPNVEVGVDPTRTAEAAMIGGILMKYGSKRYQGMFSEPASMRGKIATSITDIEAAGTPDSGQMANVHQLLTDLDRFYAEEETLLEPAPDNSAAPNQSGLEPIRVETTKITRKKTGPQNAYAVSFPQGIIWGIIGVAAAFGISIVVERTRGTLIRLRMSPISISQILAGKALACFATTFAISCFLLIMAITVFGVQVASLWLLLLAVVSSCLCFVGIMMLLSVLGKTEQAVGGIGWAVLLIMSMLGGGMIPLFIMPKWMVSMSHVSPVKWSILSLEGAMWRGFSLHDMLVPCSILLSIGLLAFSLGVFVFRHQDN